MGDPHVTTFPFARRSTRTGGGEQIHRQQLAGNADCTVLDNHADEFTSIVRGNYPVATECKTGSR